MFRKVLIRVFRQDRAEFPSDSNHFICNQILTLTCQAKCRVIRIFGNVSGETHAHLSNKTTKTSVNI